jgi:lipoprotein-anchoring transpeptidase ErfK/SrfK
MTDDELERRLRDAFQAKAQSSVPESRVPPPLRDVHSPVSHRAPTSSARWLAPLAAAVAVLFVVGVTVIAMRNRDTGSHQVAIGPSTTPSTAVRSNHPSSTTTASGGSSSSKAEQPHVHAKPVHVSSAVLSDGSHVGVGMPIILLLSKPIKQAHDFAAATKVTVNGHVVNGGWYFERKYGDKANPIEADYRTRSYWPGHARIHMQLDTKGVSAGKGLAFDDNLSLDFTTGAANILTVNDATHQLTVMSDGKQWPDASTTFPVSLGSNATPTKRGVKVIMEKGRDIAMRGPGYYDPHVKMTQRLTYDGEYLHSAPWNVSNIENGVDSSNGCTNLLPADAKRLYDFLEIGDVVQFPNANGPLMSLGDGYGDWNVPWPQWETGGLYRTN